MIFFTAPARAMKHWFNRAALIIRIGFWNIF